MVRDGRLYRSYMFQSGDVLGFVGRGWLSAFINLVTFGIPRVSISHVGLIIVEENDVYVVESLLGKGVVKRPYSESVRGETVYLYPLSRETYAHEDRRIRRVANSIVGVPYSERKAFWAGGFLTHIIGYWTMRENSRGLFCSEAVSLVLSEAGPLSTGSFSSWSPNRLVRHLVRAGICERPVKLPDMR